jgi:hypothetical protein
MQYVARVFAIFPEGTSHPNTLDAWDATITLRAVGARKALDRVISISRSVFEDPANVKMLGYSSKPVLYVVSSISTTHRLRGTRNSDRDTGIVVTDMFTLTKHDVEMLKTRHHVSVPLHVVHIAAP